MDTDIITLDKITYISGTTPVGCLTDPKFECSESPKRIPVVVVNAEHKYMIYPEWIEKKLGHLIDDISTPAFTKNVIFKLPKDNHYTQIEQDSDGFYVNFGDIPCEGPYFLEGSNLYRAYRLYEDVYNAFVCGVVQSEEDPLIFKQLQSSKYIPVPSRYYFPEPSKQKPLSGRRIAVKDVYDLNGIPTAAGCKGYGAYHGPAKDTAECIKILVDQGAVIVGKVKTVQFASGMASADWVVDICPTNSRGDGRLDTDCSSSGSAAAIAGYEWLDFSIGSDSLGSMTGPASACGVFGMRPSVGALSNVGAVPVSAHLDTPGHFSRSIYGLSGMAEVWLKPISTSLTPAGLDQKPTTILVPEESKGSYADFKITGLEQFVRDLEEYCEVEHTAFSISDLWRDDPKRPPEFPSLNEYLQNTVAHIQLHDCWQTASRFLDAYSKDKFGPLEIDPLIRYKWELGKKVTEVDYETALERKEVFREFLERKVFVEGTIMVVSNCGPDIGFRDVKTPEDRYDTWQGFGLQNTTYSVLGGLPALNIPVDQRPYPSTTTGEMANKPVSVMVLGPRGLDIWLLQNLEKAVREDRRGVQVGSETFWSPR